MARTMGAIAMGKFELLHLFLLFLIGFFGHTYGFVLNDIIDYKIDKLNKDLSDRPLISGTISIRKALIFAIVSMIVSFIIAIYLSFNTNTYFPLIVLLFSASVITIYNIISKNLTISKLNKMKKVELKDLLDEINQVTDIKSPKKSDYIKYSRFIIRKLHKMGCYGKGSMYRENLLKGLPDMNIAKKVQEALIKQKICLRKKKQHGWKYYLNKNRLNKIKEIIKEKGRISIIPILLLL